MIWIKEYNTQGEILLAACDDEVLGKTFCEGELQLMVSESFYGGEKVSQKVFESKIKCATIVNLVGSKVCAIATELGMISGDCIITIQGVPHAQIARMI